MTNPENALGTNGAYGGRTSVNAFNDVLSAFRNIDAGAGILSGWEAEINDAQQLEIGGKNKVRDVAIAEDPNGNLTTIDNISGVPIALDLPAPPVAGTRYDMAVAYVVNPPQGTSTSADNPAACGIIIVDGGTGGASASGVDETIRQAITQDGAAGTTAYYVVLCQVLRTVGQVVISPGNILPGKDRSVGGKFPVAAQNIDWSTMPYYTETRSTNSSISTSSTSPTVLNSVTVQEAGIYLVLEKFTIRQTSSGKLTIFYGTTVDHGETLINPYAPYLSASDDGLDTHNPICVVRAEAGAEISATLYQGAGVTASIDFVRSIVAVKIAG